MAPKKPVNILLVDDQPGKLLSYETILADLEENLIRANSGNEALEHLLRQEIAVVLVDVCMPGMDGFELASMIRRHPRFQRTAIILVSGVFVEDVDRLRGYDSGAVDYVSVPIIPEILRAKVSVFADLFRKTAELERLNAQLENQAKALQQELALRKKAEEALQKYAVELERSNSDLQQFAYAASHDLQEPLRMVITFVQLLAEKYQGQLDSDADEFIGYAVEGATRMKQLISDLLAYSRVGTTPPEAAGTDCEAVFQDTLINLSLAVQEKGAIVTSDPLPTVMVDRSQMAQLMQNLLANAIKFSGPRKPRVHMSAQRAEGEWLFSVRDNGIGISPEHQERVFVIFQRLHARTDYPGTGVGLAICKKIVERHGGRIWVESRPGEGSTFLFTIPSGGRDSEQGSSDRYGSALPASGH